MNYSSPPSFPLTAEPGRRLRRKGFSFAMILGLAFELRASFNKNVTIPQPSSEDGNVEAQYLHWRTSNRRLSSVRVTKTGVFCNHHSGRPDVAVIKALGPKSEHHAEAKNLLPSRRVTMTILQTCGLVATGAAAYESSRVCCSEKAQNRHLALAVVKINLEIPTPKFQEATS